MVEHNQSSPGSGLVVSWWVHRGAVCSWWGVLPVLRLLVAVVTLVGWWRADLLMLAANVMHACRLRHTMMPALLLNHWPIARIHVGRAPNDHSRRGADVSRPQSNSNSNSISGRYSFNHVIAWLYDIDIVNAAHVPWVDLVDYLDHRFVVFDEIAHFVFKYL